MNPLSLVALMQYLRIFLVAGIAALVARMFGVSSSYGAAAIVWFPEVHWLPLAETLALAIVGPLVARVLKIPAGAFLVPHPPFRFSDGSVGVGAIVPELGADTDAVLDKISGRKP